MEIILNKVRQNLTKFLHSNKKNSILVAVSGGKDSISLLNLLIELKKEFDIDLSVAYINHNLRGIESEKEEKFVTNYIKSLKLPFYKKVIGIHFWDTLKRESVEMAARKIRYDFFKQTVKKNKIDFIATAHNFNDKIETFFIQTLRSGGVETLTSIPEKNGIIIRPIINITRLEIEDYVRNNNLMFIEDSTNQKDIYKRNIVRNKIIPVLSEIQPNFYKPFSKMFEILNEENQFIDKLIKKIYSKILISQTKKYIIIDAKKYKNKSIFVQKRIIKLILGKLNYPANLDKFLFKMLTIEKKIVYKKKNLLCFERGNLLWFINSKLLKEFKDEIIVDKIPFYFKDKFIKISIQNSTKTDPQNIFSFKYDNSIFPLKIRGLNESDTLKTSDNIHITKILKNMKIPSILFGEVIVIEETNKKIIGFIFGDFFRISKDFYIDVNLNKNVIINITT